MNKINIQQIIDVAIIAGEEILSVYHDELKFNIVDFKTDDSPLTLADQKSHDIIATELERLYPNIPVLSEEGRDMPYNVRKEWKEFWLVDPLDGTKEFIKRNGEFTVNIALIRDGYPALGVIYAPVLNITYYGQENEGAFKVEEGNTIQLNCLNKKDENLIAVRSRSHASPEEEEIFDKYHVTDFISVGSSLKFCMVAEGKADLYYRHGPTMEWDTGAGQAILENAGFRMENLESKIRFSYNKESLLNPGFIVY